MYITSTTSCCTALIHVLFQSPAALILLGFVGISSVVSVDKPAGTDEQQQCSIQIRALEFAKGSGEERRLNDLTRKALQIFASVPTGTPSSSLVSSVLGKIGNSSKGTCASDTASVMADPNLLRTVMTLYFLDILSTSKNLEGAVATYKKNTNQ